MKKVALYNPYLSSKGGGEKVCLALAASLQSNLDCDVYLVTHDKANLSELSDYFKIDLSKLRVLRINFDGVLFKVLHRLPLPGKIRNIFFDRRVLRTVRAHNFDVFVNNCYQSNLPSPTKNGVYMCMFPQRLHGFASDVSPLRRVYIVVAAALSRLILHPKYRSPIDTYEVITANSAYTQAFIERLWQKQSSILYPICENMFTRNIGKEKMIFHVGRFFANDGESHHKRQDALLKAFVKMKDLQEAGWQLHFAGSVAEDVGALKYILQLMRDAQGLPVFFHFNAPFSDINKLYNQATVYWHATGFGSDPEKHPEKQEHFGISTVEAMSAGAIPIVINSAGQKESVVHGENGYLWDSLTELEAYTRQIAASPPKAIEAMQAAARTSAKRYDGTAFKKNVAEIFNSIVKEKN